VTTARLSRLEPAARPIDEAGEYTRAGGRPPWPGHDRRAVLADANARRMAAANAVAVARATRALAILGDAVLAAEGDTARLRISHPHCSLSQLAALAGPGTTKDGIAGRLRRLFAHADQSAEERGIPGTAVEPDALVAEALFASDLSRYAGATAAEIRAAVEHTLAKLGLDGCVEAVTTEFGDHPETARARMCWCRAATAQAYAGRSDHHRGCSADGDASSRAILGRRVREG